MTSINRVILAGNMTRDPEFKKLPSDSHVASFGMATNRRYKDKAGNPQEETTFVDCEAFGRQAEVLRDYGRKGRGVFVEGRLRLDQWQDREGRSHNKLRVVVDRVQFTDRRDAGRDAGPIDAAGGEYEEVGAKRSRHVVPLEELLPF